MRDKKLLQEDNAALSMAGFGPFKLDATQDERDDEIIRLLAAIRQTASTMDDPGFPVAGGARLIRALCDRAAREMGFDGMETIPGTGGKGGTLGANIRAISRQKDASNAR